jgi:DNA-binding XRE family transcriptional regulator
LEQLEVSEVSSDRGGHGDGHSQAELAKRADLSREYVNKIEAEHYDPPLSTLEALAKALRVKVGRLVE